MIHYGGSYDYDDANPCDEIYINYYNDYYYNETKPLYLPGPEGFLRIETSFEIHVNDTNNTQFAPSFIEIRAVEKSREYRVCSNFKVV